MPDNIQHVSEEYDNYMYPEAYPDFIKWLAEKVAATGIAPEKVNVTSGYKEEYGDTTSYICLKYTRPKTPREIAVEKCRRDKEKKWEIEQLRKLKAKYPNA